MASLRAIALATGLFALGSCGRSTTPTTPPSDTTPQTDGVRLRYAPTTAAVQQRLELDLTHTSLGLYLEAKLIVDATLDTTARGEALRATWTLTEIPTVEMVGTVGKGDPETTRRRLKALGPRTLVIDPRGVLDPSAADEGTATDGISPAVALVLVAFDEHLRLPRLPDAPLQIGEPVEVEEESETVLTDAGVVLPTTTVHRFTLRGVDDVGVAEIAVELASVAEPNDDELADEDADAASAEAIRVEILAEGTLLFDVERGLPVSLELVRTERFEIGDQEVDRGLSVRSEYRLP